MSWRFLRRGFVFILLFAVLFTALSLFDAWLRRDRTFYTQTKTFEAAAQTSLIFLGDSHVMFALEGASLPVDWYVYAYPGDNLRDSYAKLRHAWETQKIQAAVLSVDYHTLGTYRLPNRNLCGTLPHFGVMEAADVFGINMWAYPLRRLECAVPLFQKGEREKFMVVLTAAIKEQVFGKTIESSEPAMPPQSGENRLLGDIEKQMSGSLAEQPLIETLQQIIDYAKERNIKLIGIRLPLSNQYLRALQNYDTSAAKAVMEQAGLAALLDYSELFKDHQEYFKDISHLNGTGAAIFTPQIVRNLQSSL